MRNECSIISELLPLYLEGIVNDDTREFVDEHLAGCESCRAKLELMKKPSVSEKPQEENDSKRGFVRFMKRLKLVSRIVGVSLLILVVLANSFFIYLLVDIYRTESTLPDPSEERRWKIQILLKYSPDNPVDHEQIRLLVKLTLRDNPTILRDEPIIFIANPDLKPLVAEILEEEPSILDRDPLLLYKYPELMEMNPDLKPILEEVLENPRNFYAKDWFSNKQQREAEMSRVE